MPKLCTPMGENQNRVGLRAAKAMASKPRAGLGGPLARPHQPNPPSKGNSKVAHRMEAAVWTA